MPSWIVWISETNGKNSPLLHYRLPGENTTFGWDGEASTIPSRSAYESAVQRLFGLIADGTDTPIVVARGNPGDAGDWDPYHLLS